MLVCSLVFKTSMGREERPGWVRFPSIPAILPIKFFDRFFYVEYFEKWVKIKHSTINNIFTNYYVYLNLVEINTRERQTVCENGTQSRVPSMKKDWLPHRQAVLFLWKEVGNKVIYIKSELGKTTE